MLVSLEFLVLLSVLEMIWRDSRPAIPGLTHSLACRVCRDRHVVVIILSRIVIRPSKVSLLKVSSVISLGILVILLGPVIVNSTAIQGVVFSLSILVIHDTLLIHTPHTHHTQSRNPSKYGGHAKLVALASLVSTLCPLLTLGRPTPKNTR